MNLSEKSIACGFGAAFFAVLSNLQLPGLMIPATICLVAATVYFVRAWKEGMN